MIDPMSVGTDIELSRWIGSRIRHIRIMKNMTQEELAQRMGTQRPAVSNWENGINIPSLPTLRKMADIFGVPMRQLVEHDETGPSEGPMIPLETAVDRPGLERWIRLYERLSELGEEGQHLIAATLRLLGRLGGIADTPHERILFKSVTWTMQQSLEFAFNLLLREDQRRIETFLREVDLQVRTENDQDRFAHINQLFVPPSEYGTLFSRLLQQQHVVVLTGLLHAGKSFLGMKLLIDLTEAGYRPHLQSGNMAAMTWDVHAPEARLDDLLRDGQVVFFDDPFVPSAASLALREFAADPAGAVAKAQHADARLILAVERDALAEHQNATEALSPYVWSLDGRYSDSALTRMLVNYSEVYHPHAREPIVLSQEGLSNPHAIERTFAVGTDNRQTIRRRSAEIRREGIETLLRGDLESLTDAELTILLLVRHVPLPWKELVALFDGTDVRGIGGERVSAEEILVGLHRWLMSSGRGAAQRAAFSHPSYATLFERSFAENPRHQQIVLAIICTLARTGNALRDRIAAHMACNLSVTTAREASEALREGRLGKAPDRLALAMASLLAHGKSLSLPLRESLSEVCKARLSTQFLRFGQWLHAHYDALPAPVRQSEKWVRGDDLWARLIASYLLVGRGKPRRELEELLLEASASEHPGIRALCGEQVVAYGGSLAPEACVALVQRLAHDEDAGVAAVLRHAVLDDLDALPSNRREEIIRAAQ